ncbi:MAG TPA: DUF3048 domain-containing protein [Pseudonocardiaceae bacterium]|nr:DUF3048 domain-containing protein [Pseudonocardiaceae bacterium]
MSPGGRALCALALTLLVCVLPVVLLPGSRSASETPSPAAAAPGSPIPASPQLTPPSLGSAAGSSLQASPPTSLPPVSPFTGMPTDLGAPVLCVKIDNASSARPQTGLADADLVYVEPVEGGISRLLAVYQSRFPPVVGPVRSIRLTDLQLLANFGRPALAYSGAATEVGALVARAPVLDVSALARPGDYRRDRRRPMPYNLYGDTMALSQGGAPPRDIGFRFGPTPPGGSPVPGVNSRYRATDIGMQWVPAEARWVISMDGAPLTSASGPRPGAATVVLQRVPVLDTPIRDSSGAPSPFAATVGAGDAVVLRDGLAFTGNWSRPTPDAITTFTLPGGSPLTFAPGPVWVVLVPV